MSSLLLLVSDQFDRMINPAYGLTMNEDSTEKFGELLRDENFAKDLAREIGNLNHPSDLTIYGWIWILGWAHSRYIKLDGELLAKLCDHWNSVTFKASVIRVATRPHPPNNNFWFPYRKRIIESERLIFTDRPSDRFFDDGRHRGRNIDLWINNVIWQSTQNDQIPTRAQGLLIALLIVDRPSTIDAAHMLLWVNWSGKDSLRRFFYDRLDVLDAETREVWISRLDPPERPNSKSDAG